MVLRVSLFPQHMGNGSSHFHSSAHQPSEPGMCLVVTGGNALLVWACPGTASTQFHLLALPGKLPASPRSIPHSLICPLCYSSILKWHVQQCQTYNSPPRIILAPCNTAMNLKKKKSPSVTTSAIICTSVLLMLFYHQLVIWELWGFTGRGFEVVD